ncbi:hypothetical protein [Streptomyces parvulus]|uniref:hypothetical protein n=1 Tax=Streptomyces parvulus TaxID=146923 RepID=UPI003818A9F7
MTSVAPWAHPFPAARVVWDYSTNAGASWVRPAPASAAQVAGPTGQQRFRALVTIPPGVGGTWTATVSGDIYDGSVNVNARLFYDGVDQGPVTPLTGPTTFTLPAVPGAHDLQLRIGQADDNAGATVPAVTFNFTGVTAAAGIADGPDCSCCPVLDTVLCYRAVTTAPFRRAYLVSCGGTLTWRDVETNVSVDPADIQDCRTDATVVVPDLRATGVSFNGTLAGIREAVCAVIPTPSAVQNVAVNGTCYESNVAAQPVIDWTNTAGVEFEYNTTSGQSAGGSALVFSSTELGTVTWANTGQLNPGAQLMSTPLLGGRRVLLTYISGPLGSSPSGSVRIIGNSQVWFHQNATSMTGLPIRVRLDVLGPPNP